MNALFRTAKVRLKIYDGTYRIKRTRLYCKSVIKRIRDKGAYVNRILANEWIRCKGVLFVACKHE